MEKLLKDHKEAHQWGKQESDQCTLILAQGLSTKAQAIAGLTIVGREHYGMFPLRGKLLNVREASRDQIKQNANLNVIMQILGLHHGVKYDDANSLNSLKYGHVMIMADQDVDGFLFKGLLINMFHTFWPALLKAPSFLQEFRTPVVKATHRDGRRITFYTMPQYEAWKEGLGPEAENWTVKYYKGLGVNTSEEMKEYFRDLEKHRKDFVWENDEDGEAIELAFSEKKVKDRKGWLQQQFEHGTFLDHTDKHIRYRDFVNKELVHYFVADVQRYIPSVVDGLKPGQRKILFSLFKRNYVDEKLVNHMCGYVSGYSAYYHGEQSLASTMIGMAQDYVGSNNINLLLPNSQFGTRGQGGKDHGPPTQIYTQLSPVTRFLFPKADDILLKYLDDDGQSIEPIWYAPIIPMVLVNGSEGISNGWRSSVPNYNPLDIIANIRQLLNDKPMMVMKPWYRGFIGSIKKNTTEDSYTISGNIEAVDEKTFRITELPIGTWTQDYMEFLESVSVENCERSEDAFVEEFCNKSAGEIVHISVCMSEERLSAVKKEGLLEKLKLTTCVRTSNMHLFDPHGVIKKYETPEEILEEFFHLRLAIYERRKKEVLANLEKELLICVNKCRFIQCVEDDSITFFNKNKDDVVLVLKAMRFDPFPKKENISRVNDGKESGYDYLLSLPVRTLERRQELFAEREKLEREVEELKQMTAKSLWMRDLDALEAKLIEELINYEKRWEDVRERIQHNAYINGLSKNNPQKKRRIA